VASGSGKIHHPGLVNLTTRLATPAGASSRKQPSLLCFHALCLEKERFTCSSRGTPAR
jgi:hypothetical protein